MKKSKNLNFSTIIFQICNHTIQVIFCIMCIYPFYYILINSLSDPSKAESIDILLFPVGFTLNTYFELFKMEQIYTGFIVSVSRTVIGTILALFVTSMFAYAVTKKELFLRKTIYRITISSMYLAAGLIPWYITMLAYGLKDNFLLYVIPGAMSTFLMILMKTFMEQIPPSLEESALIDGAGYFTIFVKIVFPVSIPVIAACAVFNGVGQWNSWSDNFFLVGKESLQTLQLILLTMLRESQALSDLIRQEQDYNSMKVIRITPTAVRLAITIIVTTPILLLYPFCQRYFVKGIMVGAIKG